MIDEIPIAAKVMGLIALALTIAGIYVHLHS